MATVADILTLINSLSSTEKDQLKTLLINDSPRINRIEPLIADKRFTGGIVCPICGCIGHVSRNGHRKDGKQRYICKDCRKSFVVKTNSIKAGTHHLYGGTKF